MNQYLQGLLAAAIGGAVTAGATVAIDGGDIKGSLLKLGTVAVSGAFIAVVHLFVEKPKP